MMTSQDFQNILSNLRNKYGDITKNSDSLLAMLENNFKPVPRRQPTISMCDIEADKIYLWISADNWDNPDLKKISSMKLLYSPGYQIAREEDTDEDEEYLTRMDIEETVRRGQEVYGTDLFPNLSSFAGQKITCDSFGATTLSRQIMRYTGWRLQDPCPLVLHHQSYNFYQRGFHAHFLNDGRLGPKERSSVLYDRGSESVEWNGWSGPFLLYELLPPTKFNSLNYPAGLPLNR